MIPQFATDFFNLTGGDQIKVVQIHQVKKKIPFQIPFFEFLAVLIDKRTTSIDNLEVGNVAEKKKKKQTKKQNEESTFLLHETVFM